LLVKVPMSTKTATRVLLGIQAAQALTKPQLIASPLLILIPQQHPCMPGVDGLHTLLLLPAWIQRKNLVKLTGSRHREQ
jgi:hypothetical protein